MSEDRLRQWLEEEHALLERRRAAEARAATGARAPRDRASFASRPGIVVAALRTCGGGFRPAIASSALTGLGSVLVLAWLSPRIRLRLQTRLSPWLSLASLPRLV